MPRILIADDNKQNAELLEAHLIDPQWETRIAVDGEDTLTQARRWKPDLVLLDVMMPRISGFEVCKQLKSDPELAQLAIMMVTALDQPSDVERAIEAGADDYMTKPIHKPELLLRVNALLAAGQEQTAVDRALAFFRHAMA
jgi:DNA-binding response OmpR family regulator